MTDQTNMKNKRRKAMALLANANMLAHKESVLAGYGVDSMRDMTEAQLDDLIRAISKIVREREREDTPKTTRRLRSNILDLLTTIGVYKPGAGWDAVNKYLLQPRIAGKVLYDLSEEELKALRKKLEAIRYKQAKKLQEDRWFAANN